MKKGMSLLEIIISIAIAVIVLLIVINLFSNYDKKQVLDNTSEEIVSLLKEARSLTLSSKADSQYGVHLEQNVVVLFKGINYVVNDPNNKINNIDKKTIISNINLNNGGNDVTFQKLNGKANYYGEISVSLVSDLLKTKTITISQTGIVEKNQ